MNRHEAIAIRCAQLQGKPVKALDLQEAIAVLERNKGRGRPYKFTLPRLPPAIREATNAALCFNLGLAIGQIKQGEAA
jgi:hypothetical protein